MIGGLNHYLDPLQTSDKLELESNDIEVHVSPNPFNHFLKIESTSRESFEVQFELLNFQGKRVNGVQDQCILEIEAHENNFRL